MQEERIGATAASSCLKLLSLGLSTTHELPVCHHYQGPGQSRTTWRIMRPKWLSAVWLGLASTLLWPPRPFADALGTQEGKLSIRIPSMWESRVRSSASTRALMLCTPRCRRCRHHLNNICTLLSIHCFWGRLEGNCIKFLSAKKYSDYAACHLVCSFNTYFLPSVEQDERVVETDRGNNCTKLQMHAIPLRCKLQDREDGKLYVMCISPQWKTGGKKMGRLWEGVEFGKVTCKGLSPPISLPAASSFVPKCGPQSQRFTARSVTRRKPICLSLV